MIELKVAELRSVANALNELSVQDMSVKASFWIGKYVKKVNDELAEIDKKADDVRNKYGDYKYKHDKHGLLVLVKEDDSSFWVDESGEKLKGVTDIESKMIYWEARDTEAMKIYNKEIDELNKEILKFELEPMDLAKLTKYNAEGKEVAVNVKPFIFSALQAFFTVS